MSRPLCLLVNPIMVVLLVGVVYAGMASPSGTPSDNCIACHTDQDTLQKLAETKQRGSSETEGEG